MDNKKISGEEFMKFNKNRALEIAEELKITREQKLKIFSLDIKTPESILPDGVWSKSVEHARWLFYISPVTYKESSNRVFDVSRKLFAEKPGIFDPKYVRSMDDQQFFNVIGESKIHAEIDNVATRWRSNSERLKEFKDNPVNIFKDTNDVTVAKERLMNFDGYGTKISNMLLGFYNKYEIKKFTNMEEWEIPVDRHVYRISIGQGVLEMSKQLRHEKVVKFLEREYKELFKNTDYNAHEFQEGIWLTGAHLCKDRTMKNKSCRAYCPFEEPCKATYERKIHKERAIVKPVKINHMQEILF